MMITKKTIRHFLGSVLVLLCLSSISLAASMDLSSAKKSGLIGETSEGLVAATLPNPSGEIISLINKTNQGRLVVYKETAVRENIPLSSVQAIAAKKIFDLASSGEFLMINGRWVQK